MTIVETRPDIRTVFHGSGRRWAAAWLLVGPVVMTTAFTLAAAIDSATNGADDLEAAKQSPSLAGWASLFDLLTVPTLLAWSVVIFLITRRWAPRSAWTGVVASGLQLCGLAAVVGIELVTALLYVDGVPRATIEKVMDDGLTTTPSGTAIFLMFMVLIPIGFIATGIALWATRWVPRWVPIVFWLFPLGDMLTPDHPKWIHIAVFLALLAASGALARGVLREGAPLPAEPGHTS